MQQANLKNGRGGKVKVKKVGMYNRFEAGCRAYIRRMAKKKGMTQIQFIQNSVGIAGPDMPWAFKYSWNNSPHVTNGTGSRRGH